MSFGTPHYGTDGSAQSAHIAPGGPMDPAPVIPMRPALQSGVTLPFDSMRQMAILGHCIRDEGFFRKFGTIIQPDWFNDPRHGKVYKALVAFRNRHQRHPTALELREASIIATEAGPERTSLQQTVSAAVAFQELGADIIMGEVLDWHRARMYRVASQEADQAFNAQRYSDAYARMRRFSRDVQDGVGGGRFRRGVATLDDPPEVEFLMDDFIPFQPGLFGSINGAGGGAKTSFVVGLALHRAMGRPFLGRKTRRGRTVIVSAEETEQDFARKVAVWRANDREFDTAAVNRDVFFYTTVGTGLRFGTVEGNRYGIDQAAVDEVVDLIQNDAPGTDLIILETVNRLAADENNPALGMLGAAAEQIGRRVGAFVLLVHHVAKTERKAMLDASAPRGGGALSDNGRATLGLSRFPESPDDQRKHFGTEVPPDFAQKLVVLTGGKVNGAPLPKPLVLQKLPPPAGKRWGSVALAPVDLQASPDLKKWKASHRAEQAQSVVEFIRQARADGVSLTLTMVRERNKDLEMSKNLISDLVGYALDHGLLTEGDRKPGTRGCYLIPQSTTTQQ